MTAPGGIQVKLRCLISEAYAEQLIPGIPDEITLDQISTKLPWKSVVILSSVSSHWHHAVQSRQVYNARVRAHSTQSFLVISNRPAEHIHSISLWKSSEADMYELLPITSEYFDKVTEPWGRCTTLDGQVYVLGGLDCKVHVLDVAGLRRWKQCANMLKPRQEFGCGVIDSKLYVFGGAVNHESMWGSDLYNTEKDTWCRFRPIVSLRGGRHVPRLNEELAQQNDKFFYINSDGFKSYMQSHATDADLLEVFDPVKDEWKLVEPVGKPTERMFVARGRFYSLNPLSIHVYDFYGNSWTLLHSFSFAGIASADSAELWPFGILTDDNELLAMVDWANPAEGHNRSYMVQSRGLGSQNKELVWRIPEVSIRHKPGCSRVHVLAKSIIKL